jgi:hypothetical protein
MQIKIHQLEQAGYQPFANFQHQDLVPFLKPYWSKINPWMVLYYVSFAFPLLVMGYCVGQKMALQDWNFLPELDFSIGILFAFLSIPLHEYLHGLAYRWVGAQDVSYRADWRRFQFLTLAGNFVANVREFTLVALFPFGVLTALALLAFGWLPFYPVLGFIWMHSMACIGDFGLLSYCWEHRQHQLITFDDMDNQITYFYSKKN